MTQAQRRLVGYIAVALIAFGAFLALGWYGSEHGEPLRLMVWERSLVNHSTLIAWWFTWACYSQALAPIGVVLLVLAWRFPQWRARLLLGIVLLLVCWRGADLFQHLFARPRRLDWVVKHETSFSYPSSHAAIAVGFYLWWGLTLYASELRRPARAWSAGVLAALAIAICWSRLALGAHYLTDLAGGALLGAAFGCVAWGLLASGLMKGVAGRVSIAAE